ncbi:MAG: metallophosphoesterase [Pseudomonadota bacterium]
MKARSSLCPGRGLGCIVVLAVTACGDPVSPPPGRAEGGARIGDSAGHPWELDGGSTDGTTRDSSGVDRFPLDTAAAPDAHTGADTAPHPLDASAADHEAGTVSGDATLAGPDVSSTGFDAPGSDVAAGDRTAVDQAAPDSAVATGPFSIVLLPDTQYYTNKQADDVNNTYRKQARWVRDHTLDDNIRFTIHLGDITANNGASQWTSADHAHDILDLAGIPYSVTTGNHDYLISGDFARGNTLFDDTFGAARFAGRPWYEGALGSSNASNVNLFEVGELRFMVLSLEYAPRKDLLCRAEQAIAAHPDRRVIIATHCYLTHGGVYSTGCPDPAYGAIGSDGETVWNELASRHSNVFLVVSGHVGESAYVPRQGNAGNTVHQLVVDYQFEAACTAASASQCSNHCRAGTYTGNGWLREMVFDPASDQVHARTLTVEDGNASFFPGGQPRLFCSELNTNGENAYASDPLAQDHDFTFAQDLGPLPTYQREDLGSSAFRDRTVNSAGTGDQLVPRVAAAASGDFVVVWEDDSSTADGAGNHDILVRGFHAGGCEAFSDLVVNVATAGQQTAPAVAMDAVGNFVVAWADDNDGNGSFQIYARGFAADGSQRFATFTVNSAAAGQQIEPAVAMAPDGRFVVAWQDSPTSNGLYQIRMRGFEANGSERFTDRSVHADSAGTRLHPSLALDDSARLVVAWQDDSDGNGVYQIHARGFLADASERFALRTVNSVAAGQQRKPVVAADASGGFVVAWEDDQDGDGQFQILARGFTSAGAARLADFSVAGDSSGHRIAPAISMRSDGAFAVTWQDDSDGNGTYQIHARAFLADGSQWKPRWTVNHQSAGQQRAPHLALTGDAVVVAWEDDLDGNGAYQLLATGVDLP